MKEKLTVHALIAVLAFGLLGVLQILNIPLAIAAIAGLVILATDQRLPLGLAAAAGCLTLCLLLGGKILILEGIMLVVIPALILTVCIRINKHPVVAVCAVVAPIALLSVVYFFSVGETQGYYERIEPKLESEFRVLAEQSGFFGNNGGSLDGYVELSLKTMKMMIRFMPAIFLIIFTVMGACAYMLIERGFQRENRYLFPFPGFAGWKIAEFIMIFLGVGLLLIILGTGISADIGENLALYAFALFSFGGLSLVEYVLRKRKAGMVLKTLVYVVLIFSQVFGAVVLGVLGLIDSHFDFRRLKASRIG